MHVHLLVIPVLLHRLSHRSKRGCNDNIKYQRRPGTRYMGEMRRLSRARYHRAVRNLKSAETEMRTEKVVEALISN